MSTNEYYIHLMKQQEIQTNYDVEPAYPVEDGITWPPTCLADVKNNCNNWEEYGYYSPEERSANGQIKYLVQQELQTDKINDMIKFTKKD